MSYLLTEEQQQIAGEARRRLADAFQPEHLKKLLEKPGEYDQGYWTICQDMGWTGITIAEEFGGLGLSAIELSLVAEATGRVACGAPFLLSSFGVSEALRLWGTKAQKESWLPQVASGALKGAVRLLANDDTLLSLDGRLTGRVSMVAAGATADVLVCRAGPRLLLVDLRQPTVTRKPIPTLDNTRGYADLEFSGAAEDVLDVGDVDAAAGDILARLAILTAFEQLGGAERCMELARDYANERHAFGQPIGKFQAIKHKVAEMYVAAQLARGNALAGALALTANEPLLLKAGAARLSAIEAYDYASREAMQVHGGIGVTFEHDLHLYYRRSRALSFELGSSLMWEDLLANALTGRTKP